MHAGALWLQRWQERTLKGWRTPWQGRGPHARLKPWPSKLENWSETTLVLAGGKGWAKSRGDLNELVDRCPESDLHKAGLKQYLKWNRHPFLLALG